MAKMNLTPLFTKKEEKKKNSNSKTWYPARLCYKAAKQVICGCYGNSGEGILIIKMEQSKYCGGYF